MSNSTLIVIMMPVILLQIGLQLYAFYDLWKNREVRQGIWIWAILILIAGLLGPLAYFVLGRKGGEV